MTTRQLPHMRLLENDPGHKCVASYDTFWGATLAAEHLRSTTAVGEVTVTAVGPRPVTGWSERVMRRADPRRAVWTGALTAAVVLLMAVLLDLSSWWQAVSAVVGALVVAMIVAAMDAESARRARLQARTSAEVQASRFDVRCTGDCARAAHVLARWWSPEAIPQAGPAVQAASPDRLWRSRGRIAA